MPRRFAPCALSAIAFSCLVASPSRADNGLRLGALGTAQIDGTFSPGEWDSAAKFDFAANLLDGTTTPATLFVMNDSQNLYLAVRVRQSALPYSSFSCELDPNHDFVSFSPGNDGFVLNSFWGFFDDVRTELFFPEDTTVGGTNDGQGAVTNDGTFSYYEMSHPLRSGDVNDVALSPGASIPFLTELRLGCPPATVPCADSDFSGKFLIYPQAPPADETPPVLTVTATPTQLWPPNHNMVPIEVTVTATDDSGSVDVRLVSVTVNEGAAKGNGPSDDIQGADLGVLDTSFLVRATRLRGSSPRIYTAVYQATDRAGNTTSASVDIVVPGNRGSKPALAGAVH
jgi:endo-1,4-beta-xylanase